MPKIIHYVPKYDWGNGTLTKCGRSVANLEFTGRASYSTDLQLVTCKACIKQMENKNAYSRA